MSDTRTHEAVDALERIADNLDMLSYKHREVLDDRQYAADACEVAHDILRAVFCTLSSFSPEEAVAAAHAELAHYCAARRALEAVR